MLPTPKQHAALFPPVTSQDVLILFCFVFTQVGALSLRSPPGRVCVTESRAAPVK